MAKVHSTENYIELLRNAKPVPPLIKKEIIQLTSDRELAKESFLAKQKLKDEEFQRSMDAIKKERQRLAEEIAEKRNRDFEEQYSTMIKERTGFVADMNSMVNEIDMRNQRKKETLHQEWTQHVFNPLQQTIYNSVETQDPSDTSSRKRQAMDAFLTVNRKKDGKIFRDIILEAEYDPLQFRTENHLKFQGTVTYDPCKPKSMTKLNQDKEWAVQTLPSVYPKAKSKEIFPVNMWDKAEATPYGRYAADTTPKGRKKCEGEHTGGLHSFERAICDDYNVPDFETSCTLRIKEQMSPGKRITGPMKECEEVKLKGKRAIVFSPLQKMHKEGKRYIGAKMSGEQVLRGKKILPRPPEGVEAKSPAGKRVYTKPGSPRPQSPIS